MGTRGAASSRTSTTQTGVRSGESEAMTAEAFAAPAPQGNRQIWDDRPLGRGLRAELADWRPLRQCGGRGSGGASGGPWDLLWPLSNSPSKPSGLRRARAAAPRSMSPEKRAHNGVAGVGCSRRRAESRRTGRVVVRCVAPNAAAQCKLAETCGIGATPEFFCSDFGRDHKLRTTDEGNVEPR